MASLERVYQLDVDLRPVESSIPFINGPLLAKGVKGALETGLCLLPDIEISEVLLRASRQLEGVLESKQPVDVIQEPQTPEHLLLDLRLHAEDVSIVLLETTDTGETGEGPADLIAMEDTEISKADRQVTIGAHLIIKHKTVAGAVHWFHTEAGLLMHFENEEIVLHLRMAYFVVNIMA